MFEVKFKRLIAPVLISICCLICYFDALSGDYAFDDTVAIVRNTDVTELPTNLSSILRNDFWGNPLNSKDSHKSFRPLTTLMFHVEYSLLGFRSKQMKTVNLIVHIMNTLMLWKLMQRLHIEKSPITEVVAALLFAVHPVHVEAVTGVVGRAELMFCFFYLLSLLVLIRSPADKLSIDFLIIMFSCVGILFKETAIVIPLTCVFVDYMRRKVYTLSRMQQFKRLLSTRNTVFGVVSTVLLYWRLWIQDFHPPIFKVMDNPVALNPEWLVRILSQQYLYVLNIWIMLCPQWLCFDWALDCVDLVHSIYDLRLQAVLAFYGFIVLTLLRYKDNAGCIFGLGLMVIAFIPASGILKVGFVIAERVLYVPSIGFCILVSYTFVLLLKKSKTKWSQRLLYGMLFTVLISFLLRSIERAADWKTENSLYISGLTVCPKNAKVHYNIARLATDNLHIDTAIKFYEIAIRLYPDYEAALMNLGNLYRDRGEYAKAESYLNASLSVYPEFAAAWMNLGILYAAQGKHLSARYCYRQALKYRPNFGTCYYNLGNLYLDLNDLPKAMENWEKSVELLPKQPRAWANILTMLDGQNRFEDGLRVSEQALKYLPTDINILYIRANILGKMKHYIESEIIFKHMITLEPNNIRSHTNLGVLYHRWGKVHEAIESYRKAISIDANEAKTANIHLQKLLKHLRDEEERKKEAAKKNKENEAVITK